MRRPSAWQKNLIRNSLFLAGTVFGLRMLYLRVRDGSVATAIDIAREKIQTTYRDHIIEPVRALAKEVFYTMQNREEIVSERDLELSREALNRMLDNFSRSNKGIALFEKLQMTLTQIGERATNVVTCRYPPPSSEGVIGHEPVSTFSTEQAMDALMKSYEAELPNPIRGVLWGNLSTSILIQVTSISITALNTSKYDQ